MLNLGRKMSPPTCKQVKSTLAWLGFTERKQNGTSHQHWVAIVNNQFRKVTVDCPKAPFSSFLIQSMASQAGMKAKVFHALCLEKKKSKSDLPKGYTVAPATASTPATATTTPAAANT